MADTGEERKKKYLGADKEVTPFFGVFLKYETIIEPRGFLYDSYHLYLFIF